MFKNFLKKLFPGVAWKNPVLNFAFKLIDPFDYLIRSFQGLSSLPPYSIRVRSNGVTKQFGGKNFVAYGKVLADKLIQYAALNNKSEVLEIGCGCGRTAFALADILENGNFTGMDIERTSLESCLEREIFKSKEFIFDYLDVQNDEFNPSGTIPAHTYKFPYTDSSFDVIFLVSVFTHMLTSDVKNYISEISRMLKPGGICMITTFLMDKGTESNGISFPLKEADHYFYDKDLPEVAVGYLLDFYKQEFATHDIQASQEPVWGSWRNNSEIKSDSGFAQDIILFKKQG